MTSVEQDQEDHEDQDRREETEGTGQAPRPHLVKGAHIITERIEVGVPVEVAYEQWTRYDHWHTMFKRESARPGRGKQDEASEGEVTVEAKIGPSRRHWVAELTEQSPPHRIGWRATGGVQAHGATTFHRLSDRLTKVMVEIEYRPSGVVETVGNFFRMQRRRVRRDLRLFKNHVELGYARDPEMAGEGER